MIMLREIVWVDVLKTGAIERDNSAENCADMKLRPLLYLSRDIHLGVVS